MKLKTSTLCKAVISTLPAVIASPSYATTIEFQFNGLFTLLNSNNNVVNNTGNPAYFYDYTWGYGNRTPISGNLSYDTDTLMGSAVIAPFDFLNVSDRAFNVSSFEMQGIGGGLMLGNMNVNWHGEIFTSQIVLDASGLFGSLGSGLPSVGEIIDQSLCDTGTGGLACATPSSNDVNRHRIPIGPVPIATSSFNTTGQTGSGTTLDQLSLGTDDGVGGSPMDNGVWQDYSINLDVTELCVSAAGYPNVGSCFSPVPIPSAVWLFGSGLIGLIGVARRKNHND